MSEAVKPFLFLHIPKTGGITFHSLIRKQYKQDNRYTILNKDELLKWEGLATSEKLK